MCGQWQIPLSHGFLESIGADLKTQVNVFPVKLVSLGVIQRHKFEAPGFIKLEKPGHHLRVKSANMEQKDIGNITPVQSRGKPAVVANALVSSREKAAFKQCHSVV